MINFRRVVKERRAWSRLLIQVEIQAVVSTSGSSGVSCGLVLEAPLAAEAQAWVGIGPERTHG
jgi:hypothetical protein